MLSHTVKIWIILDTFGEKKETANSIMYIQRLQVLILLFLATFSSCGIILSQVAVERSTEKAVISGIPYYIHSVRKGETVYSISRAYGITTGELLRDNPDAGTVLKEGTRLKIEVSKVSVPQPVQAQPYHPPSRDESKYIYHILKPRETVFQLSRLYGIPADSIISSNPGIDISKIPEGSEIAIPKKKEPPVAEEKPVYVPGPKYHKVAYGESMASIAARYGITVRELRRLNKGIRFPQVGDYLIVPGTAEELLEEETEQEITDTTSCISDTLHLLLPEPEEFTPVSNLSGSLNVAVLLPFYIEENARRYETDSVTLQGGKKTLRVLNRPDNWIYPGTLSFLEMYEGILLAADTLSSLGIDLNIHTYDIKGDTSRVSGLIRSGQLDNMDLIIGPVHSSDLAVISRFSTERDIPVVSPVPLIDNSLLTGNPYLFMAGSSLDITHRAIAAKVAEYPDHNIIVIHSDTLMEGYAELTRLRKYLMTELADRIVEGKLDYKELTFYSRSLHGRDSALRLSRSLSDKKGNIVIIASEEPPLMSETLMDIHSLLRRFDIKIFGYPYMRNLENLDPKYFFDLNLMVYTPYWIDAESDDVKQFNSDFRKLFYTEPSENSFAWSGYDIAYYFISGLAIHGKDFLVHPEIHNPDLLQTRFVFRRNYLVNGFENEKLYLIRYNNDYEIELLNVEEAFQEMDDQAKREIRKTPEDYMR